MWKNKTVSHHNPSKLIIIQSVLTPVWGMNTDCFVKYSLHVKIAGGEH